ncbi:telomere length regulation protein-domain-containing protein [Apodospora peruviana]|uniref:Telomere length regulation protein-domain-containing protein n=1 Tax=Apodospora peruviana TaxID=516989 RepID=A0AAE0IRM0_9PEZI|nr:telomere length regulation protein-domain-containing protein [Apodospora peruviana]
MDGFLTPVSTFRANGKDVKKGTSPEANGNEHRDTIKSKSAESPEDALEILRHEPDYQSLVSVLRLLSRQQPDLKSFSIGRPGPLAAQLVQALVTEIVPNYWTLLKEDSHGSKSSPLGLLLACLRSIAGINAIIVRLRALVQEAKLEAGKSRRPEVSMNLGILLDLLCHLLKGDSCVYDIWKTATAGAVDNAAKVRPLAHEFLAIFGGDRIVSLSAEAAELTKEKSETAHSDAIWSADALRYTKWLGQNIVIWMLSDPTPEQTKMCSELFVKAQRLGRGDLLVKHILLKLVLAKGVNSPRFGLLVHPPPPTEQRKVLFLVLKILSEDYLNGLGNCESDDGRALVSAVAGALNSIIGTHEGLRNHLVEWLTSSSGAGLGEGVAIRRAVITVVSQHKESIVSVLEKSIDQFGDQLYIRHSPILQQEAHAQVLLLSAGSVYKKSPIKLTLLMRSSAWLNAISNRLAAPHQRARFLGMVVGETLSGLVDKGEKRLDFHMEETNGDEGKWYKSLVEVADQIGSWDLLLGHQKAASVTTKKTNSQTPAQRAPAKHPQQGFIIEELSDGELDEDDDIPSYAKPDSDEEDSDDDPTLISRDKPKAPVYIRDLIRYLRDAENYDRQKLALVTAPTLIRRKANYGTEVSEHAEELASLLIGLQDKFEIDNFDELRVQGMMAIVIAQPQTMGQWFAKTFFDGDYSVSQRASVLIILGLSARELAGYETSDFTAAAAFPSKRLPERVERLFIGGPSSSNAALQSSGSWLKPLPPNALENVAKSLTSDFLAPIAASAADAATGPDVLKLSTFTSRLDEQQLSNPKVKMKSSRTARPRVRAIPNTTAQLIWSSFFSPLTARFQAMLHSPGSRTRGIIFQPYLLALFLKTLALLIHAAGPSTLALPQMTAELWRLLLSTSIRAQAVGDLTVTQAVLFVLLALLEVNEDRMRDVCQDLGRELVEAQEWVAGVFDGLRGGDGSKEENDVKMLAAGVLVRLREGIEKYQLLMVGDLIGFG